MVVVKIDLEKVKRALEILTEGIEYGGEDVTYKVEAVCSETVVVTTKEGDIELPIQSAVGLARDLLQLYVDTWNELKERLKKFETGTWE
jgi:hypothetical protein